MGNLTPEQVKKINKQALADKHGCSQRYVSLILKGKREANTDLAKAIIKDAKKILNVLEN